MAPRGLISIGTNSTRLLIFDGSGRVAAASIGTRLGQGLDANGILESDARERTLAAIREYVYELRRYGACVDVIATSVLRRAADAENFACAVAAIVGIAPRIISGDEEAAFSFAGATHEGASDERTAVLDVGGGSTELAIGVAGAIERTISLEIGAIRLSEQHRNLLGEHVLDGDERVALVASARADVKAILEPLNTFDGFDRLLAVGGTVYTLATMLTGDAASDGVRIDERQRRATLDALLERDLEHRRTLPSIRPQRADILPAGLIIVDVACELLGVDELQVSQSDVLTGYLFSPHYRATMVKDDHSVLRFNDAPVG